MKESLCFIRIILPNPPTGSEIRATTPAAADFIGVFSAALKSIPSFLVQWKQLTEDYF